MNGSRFGVLILLPLMLLSCAKTSDDSLDIRDDMLVSEVAKIRPPKEMPISLLSAIDLTLFLHRYERGCSSLYSGVAFANYWNYRNLIRFPAYLGNHQGYEFFVYQYTCPKDNLISDHYDFGLWASYRVRDWNHASFPMTKGFRDYEVVAYRERKIYLWNGELNGLNSQGKLLFDDDEAAEIQEEYFWLCLQVRSSDKLCAKMTYQEFRRHYLNVDYPRIFFSI